PFIHVNCAISLDGRLAFAGGKRAMLSGPQDLARVQQLRLELGAVLVGVGTVVSDDPSLRVHWDLLHRDPGPAPVRICLDGSGRLPASAGLLDGSQPTIVATTERSTRTYPPSVERIVAGPGPEVDLPFLLRAISARGVRGVLVEGGAHVIASFLRARLVDRMTVYVAPVLIGGDSAPSLMAGPESHSPADWVELLRESVEPLDGGVLISLRPRAPAPPPPPSPL
ncbi:MAG TPA: dihydrofolate reductase family protein, partial [Thermoplasmata archaeon]|nr:dihydrofolate reductase family protein [Thermoplasmata archaeon]